MLLRLKKVSFIFLPILFVLMLYSTNLAQGVCPITTLKVNNIKGRVLWNDKLSQPIAQTKVELLRLGETDSFLTSTLTDNSGYFEINNIEKGLYALEAWLTVNGEPQFKYRVAIKLKKSNDTKSKSLIVVKLGLDCFNSEASVVK